MSIALRPASSDYGAAGSGYDSRSLSPPPAVLPSELVDAFEGGVSILVGTRDASLVPTGSMGVGAVVHPDRRRVTVFLTTAANERAIANARETGVIAVAFSNSIDHQTTQVKGRVVEVRPGTDAEENVCARYRLALGERLAIIGHRRAIVNTLNVWPSTAITFEIDDIFQQTPGPGAGERLSS